MEARSSAAPLGVALRAWIGPAAVAALALLAYSPLLRQGLSLAAAQPLDGWLFRPSKLPALLVLAVAGWMLWRRRSRIAGASERSAPVAAGFAAALGTGLYVWTLLTRAADLLLPSLAASGIALAAAARGRAGVRAVLLPAAVLLLGVRMPTPLQDEVVWRLQLWTAAGAAWLLRLSGEALIHGGVILRNAEHSFHVIDGCSGFAGIQILVLASLIVREIFDDAGRRAWIVVLIAPPLGFALNVLRIAYVAASPDPEALAGLEGDHTPQGLAVLAAGAGLLYTLGWALQYGSRRRARRELPTGTGERPAHRTPWPAAAAWLAGLWLASFLVPPFEASISGSPAAAISLPGSGSGWTSERLIPDPYFVGGGLGPDRLLHRRYRPRGAPPESLTAVEVLVGAASPERPSASHLLSSKLLRPGPNWIIETEKRARIWTLGQDADLVTAARPDRDERAVLYHWRLGHAGLWRESWRALLALESSPFRRSEPSRVVQLVTFTAHDGDLVLDRAKQRLDQFVLDFREALQSL